MGDSQDKQNPKMERTLRPSGGYRSLRSFQMAEIIFDATVVFCDSQRDMTPRYREQMAQAARSGRQNIAEGSCAGATSAKSEIFLTNVARGSLEELLLDYEDYLRHHNMAQWDKDNDEALAVQQSHKAYNFSIASYAKWLDSGKPEIVANTLICLCNQAIYLLKRQVAALETRLLEQGGYSEQLHVARVARRDEQRTVTQTPECPDCGKPMTRRTARQGKRAGKKFWGCSAFPKCRGTRNIEGE